MQIQPVHEVKVTIKFENREISCSLVVLSENELVVTSTEYIDKGSPVAFISKFFRGEAQITHTRYSHYQFTYTFEILHINYQPGFLVNTKL
ncbi:hypothetical protein Lrub_2767 [Legionella rubrilucens]|uniref:Uncharacterized protein n=1 Tax=Legionella rubrilucens TaxID=458 RepID=A0A0W0XNK3_9GAMM|nr:hypothetical protein [Legionella rubrilucens]KTD45970.1 hypothetical protein Lrub_2767 [Legionella rubrilucens]